MAFLLTVVGALLLLLSLAGVALGLYMVFYHRSREPGVFFALWWTPAVAAAGGILMRDPVTFTIGAFCFVVAWVALTLERRRFRGPARVSKTPSRGAEKRPPSVEAERWFPESVERLSKRVKHWLSERAQARK